MSKKGIDFVGDNATSSSLNNNLGKVLINDIVGDDGMLGSIKEAKFVEEIGMKRQGGRDRRRMGGGSCRPGYNVVGGSDGTLSGVEEAKFVQDISVATSIKEDQEVGIEGG